MTAYFVGIFLMSALLDMCAVGWTRAVVKDNIVNGLLIVGAMGTMNWLSTWLVMKEDGILMVPSILGHMVGFVVGMLLTKPRKDLS